MKHRCGGELVAQKVKIKKKIDFAYQTFTVDGFKCDNCGEEIITRDMALEIDRTIEYLKDVWKDWRVPAESKTTNTLDQTFEVDNYNYANT
ncbi:MAG: hypothetical protein AB1846_01060 [Chloroflexota bacterium]